MKKLLLPLMLYLSSSAFAQHGLQIDDGHGHNLLLIAPSGLSVPLTTISFPSIGGTLITTGLLSSNTWVLGGNTAPNSNIFGTLDNSDIIFTSGTGGPNTRMIIHSSGEITLPLLSSSQPLRLDGSNNIVSSQIDLSSTNDVINTLQVGNGGIGYNTYGYGDMLWFNGRNFQGLGIGSSGDVLTSNGSNPYWSSVSGSGVNSVSNSSDFTASIIGNTLYLSMNTLNAGNGGTGNSSWAQGDIMWYNGSSFQGISQSCSGGYVLTSSGCGSIPYWSSVSGSGVSNVTNNGDFTASISGNTLNLSMNTLSVGNGGTGNTGWNQGDMLWYNGSSFQAIGQGCNSGDVLTTNGCGAIPTWNPSTSSGVNLVSGDNNVLINGSAYNTASGSVAFSLAQDLSPGSKPSFSTAQFTSLSSNGLVTSDGSGYLTSGSANLNAESPDITGTLSPPNGGTGTSTTLTSGSVVYADISGNYSEDNSNFNYDASTQTLNIQNLNVIGIGTPPKWPSDVRFKKNIKTLENSLANVLSLRGVSYDWKHDEFPKKHFEDRKQIGFIAQELENIYPEMISTDREGYKSVDYSKMAPVLVQAMKEQQIIISKQQSEIEKLQSQILQIQTAILELSQPSRLQKASFVLSKQDRAANH